MFRDLYPGKSTIYVIVLYIDCRWYQLGQYHVSLLCQQKVIKLVHLFLGNELNQLKLLDLFMKGLCWKY